MLSPAMPAETLHLEYDDSQTIISILLEQPGGPVTDTDIQKTVKDLKLLDFSFEIQFPSSTKSHPSL